MKQHVLVLALFLMSLSAAMPGASAQPTYAETLVVSDTPNDYAQGALDIEAVYVNERWVYDAERRVSKGEHFVFRFDTRTPTDYPCGASARYDLHFKVGGQSKLVYGGITSTASTGSESCQVKAAPQSSGSAKLSVTGLTITVPHQALGVSIGDTLSDFYAQSYVMAGPEPAAQDLAPHANNNAPASTPPTAGLRSYTAIGVFPFIIVEPLTDLAQYSVGGAEVKYKFNFFSHAGIKDDNIRVFFTFPAGWTLSPSQGTTGTEPVGQLTGGSDGEPREFSFTISANDLVSAGDTINVAMEVITDTGGHVNVTTVTTISGPKVQDPKLNVTLLTPGPFAEGELQDVKLSVSYDGVPLEAGRVSIDLLRNGTRPLTFDAVSKGGGQFTASVRFSGSGATTLDVYLVDLTPSPHQAFVVNVEAAGVLSPGFEWVGLLAALGAVFLARLRRR